MRLCADRQSVGNGLQKANVIGVLVPAPVPEVVARRRVEVAALADDLTNGQENAIYRHLRDLLKVLDRDKTNATCDKLSDLIVQIQNWKAEGILTSEDADSLIVSANNLRVTIGCSA